MLERPFPALAACDKPDSHCGALRTLTSSGVQANTSEFQESEFLESQSPRDADQEGLCSCVEMRGDHRIEAIACSRAHRIQIRVRLITENKFFHVITPV